MSESRPGRWRRGVRERLLARRMAGRRLLRAFARQRPDAFFIEVGAGDGITGDHLHEFVTSLPWRGILVEPVPYVFARLRDNYEGLERVALENAAIADHDGRLAFFHFAEPEADEPVPEEYHLLGSASRERLERHLNVADRDRRIVETEVPCLSFATLCDRHEVERVDVLAIDAEGGDCAILAQVDLDSIRPRVIVYEDVHAPPGERAACARRLEEMGYETMQEGFDTWCVDARPDDALIEVWRALRDRGPALPRAELERWFSEMAKRT